MSGVQDSLEEAEKSDDKTHQESPEPQDSHKVSDTKN